MLLYNKLIQIFIFIIFIKNGVSSTRKWHWTWMCNEKSGTCKRELYPNISDIDDVYAKYDEKPMTYRSLDVCRLLCGPYSSLWPIPTGSVKILRQAIPIHPSKINFEISETTVEAQKYFNDITQIFIDNLWKYCGNPCNNTVDTNVTIYIYTKSSDLNLNWYTNESYSLEVTTKGSKVSVQIASETVFGARHALESLSQLAASYDETSGHGLVMVAGVRIKDEPVYAHRGILIDTARNFLPVKVIKRQIDAMAASKLNVLHWHATDTQSFGIECPSVPQFTQYGAYSENHVYKPTTIKNLLRYALLRGVRIILELDAPSHAGNGWQWGPEYDLGDLAVCINQEPYSKYCIQPPCGQLNPANENLYDVLGHLYQDVIDIFKNYDLIHMGGDEVFLPCWNSSAQIIKYLKSKGLGRNTDDFLYLWSEYQSRALKKFDEQTKNNNSKVILWSSQLTEANRIQKYLNPQRYVIQIWRADTDPLPKQLLQQGYNLIMSTKNAWYFDHGFWGTTKYYNWVTVYKNKILRDKGVLGGEVCMWGEYVDKSGIDSRLWPRAAAAAERLWSDPETNINTVLPRFYRQRDRLLQKGIAADPIAPGWCYQNEGNCSGYIR